MNMRRFILYIFISAFFSAGLAAQEVPHSLQNTGVYRLLDELAAAGVVNINQTIKPYSRRAIALWLTEARNSEGVLTSRQLKEVVFYLRDFGKETDEFGEKGRRRDLLYYKDDLFSVTVNPILGGEAFLNSAGRATFLRNGAEAHAKIGGWGFYASLRDNHEKPLLGRPEYLTRRAGGHIKGGMDWSDMRAGISYAWKWGSIALVNDGVQWGSGYNGTNIFSGDVPPFFQYRLHINPVKWFDFNYFHGSLKSMTVDSTRSYWVTNSYGTDYREVYHTKYLAANMFTFMPFEKLHISAGNSIIYSDYGINPVFLIPVLFFKSVDHSMNSGIDNMNSQMFFDVSSRQLRNLHLYATMFIDELSVYRFTDSEEWNFFSYKAGATIFNLPVDNLTVTAEFTYTYPLTFQHYVPTLTFESNRYNMGHYLKDNSREWYFSLSYRPLRTLDIRLWYTDAVRGPDFTSLGGSRLGNPPLATIEWSNRSVGLNAEYQVINDLYVWLSAIKSNIQGDPALAPAYFRGEKVSFNVGLTAGF
jgi:hypothetical protein